MTAPRQLFAADTPHAAWSEAVRPWLQTWAQTRGAARPAIVVPTYAYAVGLRARWLGEGGGFWRVDLLTIPELRRRLAAHCFPGQAILGQPEAMLTLAAMAHAWGEASPDDAAVAQAVSTDASLVAQALAWADAAEASTTGLLDAVRQRLLQAGNPALGWSEPQADRRLAEATVNMAPLWSSLLVWGMGWEQGRDFRLLQAACLCAEAVTAVVTMPGDSPSEQAHLAAWEKELGEAQWVTDDAFAVPEPPVFGQTPDPEAEAVQLVAQAVAAGGEVGRPSVIVVPKASPVARLVTAQLAALQVPHLDGLGHHRAYTEEGARFAAWRHWQQHPTADAFLALYQVLPRARQPLPSEALEKALRRATQAVLTDDFTIAANYLRATDDAPLQNAIALCPLLPALSTMGTFCGLLEEAARELNIPTLVARWQENRAAQPAWADLRLPRSAFLRWAEAVAREPGRERTRTGREPFAGLVVLPWEDAGAFAAEALFLGDAGADARGGVNPYLAEAGPARRAEVVADRQAGSARLRAEALRALSQNAACTHVSHVGCEDPLTRRTVTPGMVLRRLFAESHQGWPEAHAFPRWQGQLPLIPVREASLPVAQTAFAWEQRRDPTTPFDAYSLCLPDATRLPTPLSASALEAGLLKPMLGWWRGVLRVRAPQTIVDDVATPRLVGEWVHAWLATAIQSGAQFTEAITAQAVRAHQAAAYAWSLQGNTLSPLWWGAWETARQTAFELAARVETWAEAGATLEAEVPLPPFAQIATEAGALPLTGRSDLLVTWPEGRALVVDFKTGSDTALSLRTLPRGKGLQIPLYALAWSQQRGVPVDALLLPRKNPAAKALTAAQLVEIAPLLEALVPLAAGKIGQAGLQSGERAQLDYLPLAVTGLPPAVWQAKWARTHPNLPLPS